MMQIAVFTIVAVLVATGSGTEEEGSPLTGGPCPLACNYHYLPVCATLVTQFGNPCTMTAAQCQLNKNGLVLSSAVNATCPGESRRRDAGSMTDLIREVAAAKRDNSEEEECEEIGCTREFNPVCATYTATFANQCVMDATLCSLEKEIYQAFDRVSQTDGTC